VVVALGARPTGGYGIIIDGAYERDNRIEVIVQSQSPGKSCATTQAVTQPVDIVLLPKMDRPIDFRENEYVHECQGNETLKTIRALVRRRVRKESVALPLAIVFLNRKQQAIRSNEKRSPEK
jgi:hypothetical protein